MLRMPIGICELCKNKRDLRDSHVWSKFAYKQYVSNREAGGRFVDLRTQKHHNKQVTDYLLCEDCEQRLSRAETSAAQWLQRVEGNPTSSHHYPEPVHDFALSLSWRTALYYQRLGLEKEAVAMLKLPCRHWRQFLLGKRKDVLPYSQHGFIHFGQNIEGKDAEWHKFLGGQVFPEERLILSRIGPLLIVGLLERRHLSLNEINTWELSRLRPTGGVIHSIAKNRPDDLLTAGFARLLNRVEQKIIDFAARMKPLDGSSPLHQPRS